MRKLTSIFALLLLGGLVLSGCGSTPDDGNMATPTDNSGSNGSGGNGGPGGSGGGSGGGSEGGGSGGGSEGGGSGGGSEGGGSGGGSEGGGSGEGGGQGQGGEGEVPQDSRFVNKKLTVESIATQPQVAAIEAGYANAYISFFSDGSCELVAPHDSVYDVLFGTYNVNQLDNVAAITIKKMYDGLDELYSWSVNSSLRSITVEYLSETDRFTTSIGITYPATTMTLTLRSLPNPPMHIVGDGVPADPNGDSFDSQYQVEQYRFDQYFVNDVLRQRNFTVEASVPGYMPGIVDTYKVEVQDFKVRYSVEGNALAETYYLIDEFVTDAEDNIVSIRVDAYHKDTGGNWVETQNAQVVPEFFQNYFGFIPVPFLSTEYSPFTHAYSASRVEYRDSNDYVVQINQFKAYFENSNIKKITYKNEIQEDCEFNFSAHGTTIVQLPDAGGQGGGEPTGEPSDYNQYIQNKVLTYDRATNSGDLEPDELELAAQANADIKFNVFNDMSVEIEWPTHYYIDKSVQNAHVVFYGSIAFTGFTALNGQYVVRATISIEKVIHNNVDTGEDSFTLQAHWFIEAGQLRVKLQDDVEFDDYYVYLNPTNTTPTHIPLPEVQPPYVTHGIGENWVKSAMQTVGQQVQIEGLTLAANEQFVINVDGTHWKYFEDFVLRNPDTANGKIIQGDETTGGKHNLKAIEAGTYDIYVNSEGEVDVVHGTQGGGGGGGQGGDPADTYPTEALEEYFDEISANDVLPDLHIDGATYEGQSYEISGDLYFYLMVTPGEDKTTSQLAEEIEALLSSGVNKLTKCNSMYCSPNGDFGVMVNDASTMVLVTIREGSPAANYPASKIESAFSSFTDSVIDFSVDGAVYLFDAEDIYPVLTVIIDGYNSYDYSLLADEYMVALDNLGYGWKYDENASEDLLVSPNREIGIEMNYDDDGLQIDFWDVDGDDFTVDYQLAPLDSGIFAGSPYFFVWIWGGDYGDGQWIEIYYDDYESAFLLEDIDDKAEGMVIARLSDYPEDYEKWDNATNALVLNQTDNIDITGNNTYISFHFNGTIS